MSQGQIPVFIINLDRSPDRFQQISGRLSELGVSFERVAAIDGNTISTGERRKLNPNRIWLKITDSEIACYASHLKALALIVERSAAKAMILEDDVLIDDDFSLWLDGSYCIPEDVDVLKFEGFGSSHTLRIPIYHYATRDITFAYKPTGGAAAYLITLAGAKKVLKNLDVVRDQIDTDLFAYWITGLRTYELYPFPVRQQAGPSTINHSRAKISLRMKVARNVIKRYFKVKRLYSAIRVFGIRLLVARFGRVPSGAPTASQ